MNKQKLVALAAVVRDEANRLEQQRANQRDFTTHTMRCQTLYLELCASLVDAPVSSPESFDAYRTPAPTKTPPIFWNDIEREVWTAAFARGAPWFANWDKISASEHADLVLQGFRDLCKTGPTERKTSK